MHPPAGREHQRKQIHQVKYSAAALAAAAGYRDRCRGKGDRRVGLGRGGRTRTCDPITERTSARFRDCEIAREREVSAPAVPTCATGGGTGTCVLRSPTEGNRTADNLS